MKHLLHKFKNDNSGNVAMILAICLIPLMGFVGFALDYNQASRQKALLQSASDMAALYIAKMKDPNKASKAQEIAETMVREMAKEAKITDLNIKGVVANKKVTVTADAASPNSFSQMFGYKNVRVGVLAEATYAAPKIEVGLVLDNTKSMCYDVATDCEGFKAIVPATHNLLDLLSGIKEDNENLIRTAFINYNTDILQSSPLTTDYGLLHNMADKMIAKGSTNTGKAMLASHKLLKDGASYVKKFMIVVTDGNDTDKSAEELWIEKSCPIIRQDNSVTIFTIGLGIDLDPEILIACSGEKYFFHVKDQKNLDDAFKKIFAEISGLRLTR